MPDQFFPQEQVASLPDNPGIYQFFDKNDQLLYIGKAKNLKKRVASYFSKSHNNRKLEILVSKIFNIRHIVVESEQDALLLENNLIKNHQPRYNVLLKDDKTFPWICIKQERFPRVFSTRNVIRDGSRYFGPYTSGLMVKTLLDLFRQLYPLRNCTYLLSDEQILSGKLRVCLEYHIGNCLGPCIGKQTEPDYNEKVEGIIHILKGNSSFLLKFLKDQMLRFSADRHYEEAQKIKERIELLERYQSKSTIVNPDIRDVEVYSVSSNESSACVNFLHVVCGAIIRAHTIEIKKRLDETNEDILTIAITDIRQRFSANAPEIIIPFPLEFTWKGAKNIVPKIGDKLKLLELSQRNATYYRLEKQRQAEKTAAGGLTNRVLGTVMKDFRMKEMPVHIECFDNSNLQGSDAVAACVVFKQARPAKKEYRHFNIKTVSGIDDFASMKEIILRRYTRMLDEGRSLPQLIVVDGGKGQLSSAADALQSLGLSEKITLIGIAKRLEEIFFPDDSIPLYLDKNSESLRLIQQIRNEAHRFGITFHRDKRSKKQIVSELDQVPGIGPATKELLFNKLKSVEKIKAAGLVELSDLIGKHKAEIIISYFAKRGK